VPFALSCIAHTGHTSTASWLALRTVFFHSLAACFCNKAESSTHTSTLPKTHCFAVAKLSASLFLSLQVAEYTYSWHKNWLINCSLERTDIDRHQTTITDETQAFGSNFGEFALLSIDFQTVIPYEKCREYRSRYRDCATDCATKVSWSDCRNVSAKGFRPPLGPTQPPVKWLPWTFSQRQSGRTQTNHSPPSGTEVTNEWSYPSTSPIRLHGVHRNKFAVNFVLQRS
jgi:hypothetical protein